ncbi:hypothetical protein CP556_23820 [Natrinema sp. CBA1119]|nr:hypothetical protein CP556_23820 [Natrinema sp. CBA1119]
MFDGIALGSGYVGGTALTVRARPGSTSDRRRCVETQYRSYYRSRTVSKSASNTPNASSAIPIWWGTRQRRPHVPLS